LRWTVHDYVFAFMLSIAIAFWCFVIFMMG
jgi:hypothetical protein